MSIKVSDYRERIGYTTNRRKREYQRIIGGMEYSKSYKDDPAE